MSLPSAARNAAARQAAMRDAEQYVITRLWALEDDQVAQLAELYFAAYAEMAGAVASVNSRYGGGDTWSAGDALFRARTEATLDAIYGDVTRLTDQATADVMDTAVRGYQGGYYGRAWLLDQGLRGVSEAALPYLPVEAIRAAVLSPYFGSTFLDRFADARAEFERLIRQAIVESQIRGETIGQAVNRLAELLGIAKGADGKRGYAARLEKIARTELIRSSNLGAMAIYQANPDVLKGWSWLATNDKRTCPVCGALDGQHFALDSQQSPPPQHPLCRCSATPDLIDTALEAAIVGPRESYADWAARQGVTIADDGGALRESARAYAGMWN